MSIVDDWIQSLVERNGIRLTGALAIQLVDGGVTVSGAFQSVLRDQNKNKDLLKINIPVIARVKVGEIVIALPNIP
jgi:hypothetical protein